MEVVPKEEVELWKTKDPITSFENLLIKNSIIGEQDKFVIQQKLENEIALAHKSNSLSQYPEDKELFNHVYAQ